MKKIFLLTALLLSGLCRAQFVIAPQFDNLREFSDDLAAFKRAGSWGFIDRQGEISIIDKYGEAGDFSEGLAPVAVNGSWGFINKKGEMVVPPHYEAAGTFAEGLAPVKRFGFWGYIDTTGKEVIDTQFGEAGSFSEGLAAISLKPMYYDPHRYKLPDGQWGFIDKTGKVVIKPTFSDVESFKNGMAEVRTGSFDPGNIQALYGHYGLLKPDGTFLLPPEYGQLSNRHAGLIAVRKEGQWGYINSKGEFVIPLHERFLAASGFKEGLAAVKIRYNAWGYINASGEVKIPADYWTASDFSEGIAFVTKQVGLQRFFIDKTGNILPITPPEQIREFRNGIAAAAVEDPATGKLKWGFYGNPLSEKKHKP